MTAIGSSDTRHNLRYIPSLDGLRCVAVVLVLLVHGGYGYFKGGFIGVDLFFVLSGYLITSLLRQEYGTSQKISFKHFYARRVLRLLPALVLCLIIGNILWNATTTNPDANRLLATASGLFYFANLVPGAKIGILSHLWSLSVEEHFYFIWPLFVSVFLFRQSAKTQTLTLLGLILAVITFRGLAYHFQGSAEVSDAVSPFVLIPYRFTFCRIDSIMMGALISVLLRTTHLSHIKVRRQGVALAAFLVLLIPIGLCLDMNKGYMYYGGFAAVDVFCALFVLLAVTCPQLPVLSSRLFRWVGSRSYGIYLYHIPIFVFCERFRTAHSVSNLVIVTLLRFGMTFLIAELSFRFVETPILRLKRHFQVAKETEAQRVEASSTAGRVIL